ncbi:unnamed protein product [Echinostoma caproni]|uniref:Uncharacterized protein n=1 Tax=Echinostoma caproni TaxID=27848 RepID=A0A183B850_9TREM|nr:unnamed protein product [Echinostoma caproni]
MRYLNLSWILMMRLISDQIASRFTTEEETMDICETPVKPMPVRRKPTSTRHKISRNTCHPWSIDATEAFRPAQTRSFLQSTSNRHENLSVHSPDPCSPLTPFTAPLATEDGGFTYPDAFQAVDDAKLREDLLAFNRDKRESVER